MHIVEHALLQSDVGTEDAPADQFYQQQITVLLPGWTARGGDQEFRQYARQVIRELTPVHLYAHVIWLDLRHMYKFEGLFKHWLSLHKESPPSKRPEGYQQASVILARCLQRFHEQFEEAW